MAGCVDEGIRVASAEGIDADIRRVDNLTVATNPAQLERAREECETIRAWDVDPTRVEMLDQAATRARINIRNVMQLVAGLEGIGQLLLDIGSRLHGSGGRRLLPGFRRCRLLRGGCGIRLGGSHGLAVFNLGISGLGVAGLGSAGLGFAGLGHRRCGVLAVSGQGLERCILAGRRRRHGLDLGDLTLRGLVAWFERIALDLGALGARLGGGCGDLLRPEIRFERIAVGRTARGARGRPGALRAAIALLADILHEALTWMVPSAITVPERILPLSLLRTLMRSPAEPGCKVTAVAVIVSPPAMKKTCTAAPCSTSQASRMAAVGM